MSTWSQLPQQRNLLIGTTLFGGAFYVGLAWAGKKLALQAGLGKKIEWLNSRWASPAWVLPVYAVYKTEQLYTAMHPATITGPGEKWPVELPKAEVLTEMAGFAQFAQAVKDKTGAITGVAAEHSARYYRNDQGYFQSTNQSIGVGGQREIFVAQSVNADGEVTDSNFVEVPVDRNEAKIYQLILNARAADPNALSSFPQVHGIFKAPEERGFSYTVILEKYQPMHAIPKKITNDRAKLREIFQSFLADLAWLHQCSFDDRPLYHNDMKPQNLLWDSKNERLILIDFGVAHSSRRMTGGSPFKIAPESSIGVKGFLITPRISQKNDTWAAGLLFFQLATGMQASSTGEERFYFLPDLPEMEKACPENPLLGKIPQTGLITQAMMDSAIDNRAPQELKPLLKAMLKVSPSERATAEEALRLLS